MNKSTELSSLSAMGFFSMAVDEANILLDDGKHVIFIDPDGAVSQNIGDDTEGQPKQIPKNIITVHLPGQTTPDIWKAVNGIIGQEISVGAIYINSIGRFISNSAAKEYEAFLALDSILTHTKCINSRGVVIRGRLQIPRNDDGIRYKIISIEV